MTATEARHALNRIAGHPLPTKACGGTLSMSFSKAGAHYRCTCGALPLPAVSSRAS